MGELSADPNCHTKLKKLVKLITKLLRKLALATLQHLFIRSKYYRESSPRFKRGFTLVKLIRAMRKVLINWFTEHAHIILINFLTKFSYKKSSSR